MDDVLFDRQFDAPTKPYDVLSVSFFRMKKSYSAPGLYAQGLVYTVDNFAKFLPGYRLRVHYDGSVEKNATFARALEHAKTNALVQLVKFRHPWFVENDGHHPGTFGTIVRLWPLFCNDEPNVRNVLVADIDRNQEMFPYWMRTRRWFEHSASMVHMLALDCNHLSERVKRIADHLRLPISPFLNSFWSKTRFPKVILDTFLKCLHTGAKIGIGRRGCEEVRIFLTATDHSKVKKANRMDMQTFMYGIDEICLLICLKYLMKHTVPHSYHLIPDLLRPLVNAYSENRGLDKSRHHNTLVRRMMGREYDERKTSQENVFTMRSLLINYGNFLNDTGPEKARRMRYLSKNIIDAYATIISDGTHDKYKLDRKLLECLTRGRANKMKLVTRVV